MWLALGYGVVLVPLAGLVFVGLWEYVPWHRLLDPTLDAIGW